MPNALITFGSSKNSLGQRGTAAPALTWLLPLCKGRHDNLGIRISFLWLRIFLGLEKGREGEGLVLEGLSFNLLAMACIQ